MNKQVFHYAVIPSVVRADVKSQIRIRPMGENATFKQGLVYKIAVRAVDTACRHFDALPTDHYEVTPDAEGCLVFEHFFAGEQKHPSGRRYAFHVLRN